MRRSSASILDGNMLLIAALVLLWPGQWLVQGSGWLNDYDIRLIMLIGIRITAAVSLQLINGISGQFSLGHAGFMAIGAYAAAYPATVYSSGLTRPFSILAFYIALLSVIALASVMIYGLYRLILLTRRVWGALPALLALAIGFWIILDFALAPSDPGAHYIWVWTALRVEDFYATVLDRLLQLADLVVVPQPIATILSYLLELIFAGLLAAGAGLLVGVPALRLRGDYLAIATLGFAEIVRAIAQVTPALGANLQLEVPAVTSFAWIYGLAILTIAAVWRLVHSARGRAMLAVREDEIAAASVGINPAHSKVLAFVVGAFFAGTAGAALVHYEGYVSPNYFDFMQSIELVVIVTLAGAGSITGTVLVTAILVWLPEQLRGFQEYRMIVYSLMLILLMLLRPNGLLGNRELIPVHRKRAHAAA